MTQGFQSRVAFVATEDGRNFTFVQPLTYVAKDGRVFVIPKGATTDGASTPKEIWPFLPPFGDYWLSSALHDCAYQNTLLVVNPQEASETLANLERDDCDNLYQEALESVGVEKSTIEKLYLGVHEFGWLAYWKDRGEKI